MLLPDPQTCINKINDFNHGITQQRTARDNCDYITLFQLIVNNISNNNSIPISCNLIRMLGLFQAYRNQPAQKNLNFIINLLNELGSSY